MTKSARVRSAMSTTAEGRDWNCTGAASILMRLHVVITLDVPWMVIGPLVKRTSLRAPGAGAVKLALNPPTRSMPISGSGCSL